MTDQSLPPLEINYRMRRGDYAALCKAITNTSRGGFWLPLAIILLATAVGAIAGSNGDMGGAWAALVAIAELQAPVWLYALLILALALVTVGRPYLMALRGAVTYKRNAAADKELRLRFDTHGIDVESRDIQSHVGWTAVRRVIETRSHLFFAVSRREALVLPRRAFSSAAAYEQLKAFAEAQLGR